MTLEARSPLQYAVAAFLCGHGNCLKRTRSVVRSLGRWPSTIFTDAAEPKGMPAGGHGLRRVPLLSSMMVIVLFVTACASYVAERDTLPRAYLLQAKQAAERRDTSRTLAALDQAEAAYLGTGLRPYRSASLLYEREAVFEMGSARLAVQMQRWDDALYYINTALTHPSTIVPY